MISMREKVARWRFAIGLAVSSSAAAGAPTSIRFAELLDAIAEVESGCEDAAIGSAGERSRYQLTEAVWRAHSTRPFRVATDDTTHARAVALVHLQWLSRQLEKRGLVPTPYCLAIAWNGGLGALHRPRPSVRDYARRVENLLHERTRTASDSKTGQTGHPNARACEGHLERRPE